MASRNIRSKNLEIFFSMDKPVVCKQYVYTVFFTNKNYSNSLLWTPGTSLEKGIRIEYPYNFGFLLGNSGFVTIWREFDLLVRIIVHIKGLK